VVRTEIETFFLNRGHLENFTEIIGSATWHAVTGRGFLQKL